MRIEGIEVINLRYEVPKEKQTAYAGGKLSGPPDLSLVRVSRPVTEGWGGARPTATRSWSGLSSRTTSGPFCWGTIPGRWRPCGPRLYQATRWYGRKGVALSALGALDIAFWDLRGKALGKTVQELMGGSGG